VRHKVLGLSLRQAFTHRTLDAHQPRAELVLGEFADRAHTAVAEVVDVVDLTAAVAQLDEDADHFDDVARAQRVAFLGADLDLGQIDAGVLEASARSFRLGFSLVAGLRGVQAQAVDIELGRGSERFAHGTPLALGHAEIAHRQRPAGLADVADATVELHAADSRKVVAVFREEQAVEQRVDGILGGRLARAHHAVDGDLRLLLTTGLIGAQGLADVTALVEVVGVEGVEFLDASDAQLAEQISVDLVVRAGDDFAGLGVDDVARQHAADDELVRNGDAGDACRLELAHVLGGDPLVLGNDQLASLVDDVETGDFTAQAIRHQLEIDGLIHQLEGVEGKELGEDLLRRVAERLQQDRDRHLATAVDPEIQIVLRVELEIEPRPAVGDDARREQQFARAVRLALVVLEEHAGRTVQLADDDALGAVDDEGAVLGHERDLAHVDLLLLELLDGRTGRLAVHDHQTHLGAQRRGVVEAALLALLDVKGRRAKVVADELEPCVARVADDREDGVERRLQTFVATVLDRHTLLQEGAIGIELGRQQIRYREYAVALGEAFADTLLFREGVGHDISGDQTNVWGGREAVMKRTPPPDRPSGWSA